MRIFESFDNQLDFLLTKICEEVQVSKTEHELAESRYDGVSKWLASSPPGTLLHRVDAQIYPQGSLNLGTPVKPVGRNEFDADLVYETRLPWQLTNPQGLVRAIYFRLRENGIYEKLLPPSPPSADQRCVTLTYANEFHLDILGACSAGERADGQIKVVDKHVPGAWKDSNPKGYASWFETRSQAFDRSIRNLVEKADVADFPDHETFKEKTPLQRTVQLLKRWRDIAFAKEPNKDLVPISILITTLSAMNYRGETSINVAMTNLLTALGVAIRRGERIKVPNPTHPQEDFGERWDAKPGSYQTFTAWVIDTERRWARLNQAHGIQLGAMLKEMFGDAVTEMAIKSQVQLLENSRSSDRLGINTKSSGLTLGSFTAGTLPVRKNTFFGGEE